MSHVQQYCLAVDVSAVGAGVDRHSRWSGHGDGGAGGPVWRPRRRGSPLEDRQHPDNGRLQRRHQVHQSQEAGPPHAAHGHCDLQVAHQRRSGHDHRRQRLHLRPVSILFTSLPYVRVWSIAINVSVRLSVRPLAYISKTTGPNFTISQWTYVAGSSSDGNAIRYVGYFYFVDDVMFSHNEVNRPESDEAVRQVPAPGAKSAVSDCILLNLNFAIYMQGRQHRVYSLGIWWHHVRRVFASYICRLWPTCTCETRFKFLCWRFVASGEHLKRSIVPNSAVVFRYDIEYLLSEQLVSCLFLRIFRLAAS